MWDRTIAKKYGLGEYMVNCNRLFIRHKECSQIMAKLGFKKKKNPKRPLATDYIKNIEDGKRIHIIHDFAGIRWHVDNHN